MLFINVYVENSPIPNVLHLKVEIMKNTVLGTSILLRYFKIGSVNLKS